MSERVNPSETAQHRADQAAANGGSDLPDDYVIPGIDLSKTESEGETDLRMNEAAQAKTVAGADKKLMLGNTVGDVNAAVRRKQAIIKQQRESRK